MAVLIKRTDGRIPNECEHRCCTEIYGKNVPKVRRRIKRASEQAWRRELARD